MSQGFIASFVISVGLNVGDQEPPGQLGRTIAALDIFPLVESLLASRNFPRPMEFLLESVHLGESHWEGVPERFIQARYRLSLPRNIAQSRVTTAVAWLAGALGQEAVAVLLGTDDRWILVRPDGSTSLGGSTAEFPVLV